MAIIIIEGIISRKFHLEFNTMMGMSHCYLYINAWVKVFRIIPEFRILRLMFRRKSASKSRIKQDLYASLIYF